MSENTKIEYTPRMNQIYTEWVKYRDDCYPDGIAAVQEHECRQAFFAGASVAVLRLKDLADLDEKAAVHALECIFHELLGRKPTVAPK